MMELRIAGNEVENTSTDEDSITVEEQKGGMAMNFDLSEQQLMLKKTTKDLIEKEIAPVAARIDKSG